MMNLTQYQRALSNSTLHAGIALDELYGLQTRRERATDTTIVLNFRGFNQADAEVLSPLARKYRSEGDLSRYEWAVVFNRLPKYAKQLHTRHMAERENDFDFDL